jgi:hypothetical protein
MLDRIRFALIRLLAGGDQVAVNLTIGDHGAVFSTAPGRRLFTHNCRVDMDALGRERVGLHISAPAREAK